MSLPLTSENLLARFGPSSPIAKNILPLLYHLVGLPDHKNVLDTWKHLFSLTTGEPFADLKLTRISQLIRDQYADLPRFYFASQTYYAIVVKLLAWQVLEISHTKREKRSTQSILKGKLLKPFLEQVESGQTFEALGLAHFMEPDIYGWYLDAWNAALEIGLQVMVDAIGEYQLPEYQAETDLLKRLYQQLIPAALRHRLGEYYTPGWLAEHILNQVGYRGDPQTRLLDPACGSGTFLVLALRRLLRNVSSENFKAKHLLCVVGYDLNPLAVLSARTNYLCTLAKLLPQLRQPLQIPVYRCDSILNEDRTSRFDCVVGNPPWVNWQDLPPDYREQTRPLWEQYGLFPHQGFDTKLGKGKKDLAMLMTLVALDRYLKKEGRLGFVITQSVFKSSGAGEGFRRFRLKKSMPVGVLRVEDFSDIDPFESTRNRAAMVLIAKGQETHYPVPYIVWSKRHKRSHMHNYDSLDLVLSQVTQHKLVAEPVDSSVPTSPWLTARPAVLNAMRLAIGSSAYRAHEGVNCGGANSVYWLEILGRVRGNIRVRNLSTRRTHRSVPIIEATIEPDLVYPLLRGQDVGCWKAKPRAHLLFVQNPTTRIGYEEGWLRTNLPETYAYLKEFEGILRSRSAYRHFFHAGGAFYSMLGVGQYTLAPYKVVWRYIAPQLMAAVVGTDPISSKVIIPDHRLMMVAASSADEAHYLAACLNNSISRCIVAAYTINTQLSTHVLEKIRIPQYEPANLIHRQLTDLSEQAHLAVATGKSVQAIEVKIDQVAAALWGIDDAALVEIQTRD